MINRTWFCLNRHCKHEFTLADTDHPPCPRCGGIHVRWVPKPIAIRSAATTKADRTVTEMHAQLGDKNFNSPRMGERMAPKVNPTPVPGRTQKFAPVGAPGAGWAVDMPLDQNGQMTGSYCGPTGVTAKVAHQVGTKVPVDKRAATATGAVPKYEATHRPPGGTR